MRQIYAEAESNANLFALACFGRRGREASDSRTRRAEQAEQAARLAWPRREPYFRRSRISRKPRAMQIYLHWHVSGGGAGRPRTHGHGGRNRRCKPPGLHGRGVNRISGVAEYRRSREQCKFICIGMFRAQGPGGLGLTDTAGGTGGASRQACMAEA